MKLHTRQLTCAAIVGAAYAVLSIFGSIFGITYGPIQCRFSEALCVLPFLLPETAWGLGVGCLIANLLSPYGVLDIVVGSAATLLAALLTARCKKKWLAPRRFCDLCLRRQKEYSALPSAGHFFRAFASGGPISSNSGRNGEKNAAKNQWFLDFLWADFDAAEKGSAGNRPWGCPRCR